MRKGVEVWVTVTWRKLDLITEVDFLFLRLDLKKKYVLQTEDETQLVESAYTACRKPRV